MRLSILLTVIAAARLQRLVHGAAAPSSYFGSDNAGYAAWLASATFYEKHAFLAPSNGEVGGVAVHWTIENDKIHLAVAAKATGWVGFGIGESGSMLGADIILYSVEGNKLVDSYVLDESVFPLVDDCQSWTLVKSTVDDGFIMFEATRLLDSADTQDRSFFNDSDTSVPPRRYIGAWGDSAAPAFHGSNTAKGSIRFFGTEDAADELESFASAMAAEAEGSFLIQAKDYLIPTNATTYHDVCVTSQDLLAMGVPIDQDLHLIGYEPVIDPRTTQFVHHMDTVASTVSSNSTQACFENATEVVFPWAPGVLPFRPPSNVGAPLGAHGYKLFSMNIHYTNVNGIPGQVDSSGLRLYYTSKKRQYNLGVLGLGGEGGYGELVSATRGLGQHVSDCDGACSSFFLSEPVTVIYETFHMHVAGASAVNTQIRNGKVIREGKVEYWDFYAQGDFAVAQPSFTIEPGDAFRTVCNYNDKVGNTTWGDASYQEMCMISLYYYPRVVPTEPGLEWGCGPFYDLVPACNATYTMTPDFSDVSQLQRSFGKPSSSMNCVAAGKDAKANAPVGAVSSASLLFAFSPIATVAAVFFLLM